MEWKEIKDFPQYEINCIGEVCNKKTKRILKPALNRGYYEYQLRKDGKTYKKSCHRLVAECFIDNPDEKEEVDHINQNKTDNRIENLRWVTHSENMLNITKNFKASTGQQNISKNKSGFMVNISRNKVIRFAYANTLEKAIELRDQFLEELRNGAKEKIVGERVG